MRIPSCASSCWGGPDMTRHTQPVVSQRTTDLAHMQIYFDSIGKMDILPPKIAVPALGVRWLCARVGYDAVLEALRGEAASKVPDAVLYEIRFCVSWLSDRIVRMPPPLEGLPAIWDTVKTLHVSSFDPDVLDNIIKKLARIRKRADTLDAMNKTVQ